MTKEQGEITPPEEYWGGHSFVDNCRWVPNSQREYLPKGSSKLLYSQGAEYSEFLDHFASKATVRTFTDGMMFDARQFPEGTLIRFSGESLFKRPNLYNSLYWETFHDQWEKDWGIILGVNGKNGRMVRILRFGFFHPGRDLLNSKARQYPFKRLFRPIEPKWLPAAIHEPVQRIGEVFHRRTKGLGIPLLVPSRFQSIERIHQIELIGLGVGVRQAKRETEAEKTIIPEGLSPVPQKI